MISYIVLFVSLNYILKAEATSFYLKTDGVDSAVCTAYESGCKTIDYVMRDIVNISGSNSIIYIDTGIYNYTVICQEGSETNAYKNSKFSLIGFILSCIIFFLYI
jgi:hypothetical protein